MDGYEEDNIRSLEIKIKRLIEEIRDTKQRNDNLEKDISRIQYTIDHKNLDLKSASGFFRL
jgi:peptidoglycan hydrolase CwlO-like protein